MKTFRVKEDLRETSTRWWCVTVQEFARNCNVVLKISLKGPGKTTTTCKSQTIDTLTKSSRSCDRNCVSALKHSMRRPMCWSGDYLCWQRWNHQFTSGFNTKRILLHTRIPTSRSSRRRSLLGWDLLCVMIRRRQISSVSTEQYFEMVWWVSWKDAGSDIPGSGQIHFKSEWSVNETVESARSWFIGTKPNEDRGSRTSVQSMIQPDSSDQSLLECATEPVMTWTTDLEIQQHHAESIHYLVLIKILWSRSGYKKYTEIGPVLEVKTFCHLNVHGIEIQIPSTSGDNTNVWVVISRGSNRYVDELRYKDPEYSPGNLEEADYGSMQETDAEQPTTQSRPQCISHLMTTFLFTKGNGKTSLPLSTATKMSWDTVSQYLLESGYVTKIAVTEKQMEQFIRDRHVRSWNLHSWSKQEIPSLTEIGSITSGREAARHDFSIARIPPAPYCTFELFKDTLGEIWSNQRWWVMSLHLSFNWKQFVISPRMLIQFEVSLGGGAHCREKRKQRRTTNCVLHSPGSLGRRDWRRISEVTCRNQERYTTRLSWNTLRTPSTGSIWPRHRKKT